ncbi:profilin [Nonomuraea sp. NPDC049400]|uniref:profilin n=1 Tax=Nonomuraea sp. NPDC049400 TaxID=3364352 RepID=UPI0037B3D217
MGEWQRYVDDNLIGSGKVNRAAIVRLDGGILAASEGYKLSAAEQSQLSKECRAVFSGGEDQVGGLVLAGNKFLTAGGDERSLFLKTTHSINYDPKHAGAIVVQTKQCIIVAEYDAPLQMAESIPVVESLADELINAGY